MRNPGGVHSLVRGGIYGLFILLLVSGSAQATIPATERQALIDLYNSTNGAGWTTSNAWKTPPLDVDGFAMPGTECSWYGVYCNVGKTTVTDISLTGNNLVGPLPATVGNLVGLVNLYLSGNELSGSIPSFATNTALRYLVLGGNHFSGSIPSFDTALQYLYLSTNQLSGSIPSFAANTALQLLEIGRNQLSGSIPSFAANTALRVLRLNINQLSGSIPPFATNTALQELELTHNQLSGSIPSFATNTALQRLELQFNQLSGSIPSFATNTALRYLNVEHNQLSGSIPSFAANTALDSLDLSDNQLSGSLPSFATNTTLLSLNGNQLTGPVDSSLGPLWRLAGLDLRWNALFSTDATLIAFLDSKQNGHDWLSTQTIPVTGLSVSGDSPTQVTVNWFPIVYTADTGYYQVFTSTVSGGPYTPFATVTANKSATSLDVSGLDPLTRYYFVVQTTTLPHANNQNTVLSGFGAEVSVGSAPVTIPATERQALIDLYNGTNGAGWPRKTAWKTPPLYIDGFAMPGTECSWYGVECNGGQTTVTSISLSSNNLGGQLPASVGNLVGLVNVSMYDNHISGSIPSFATNTALQQLNLAQNWLSGSMPSFATNTALQQLNLSSNNQLSGSIPSFATNTALQYLKLSGNQLSGSIPSFATNTALQQLLLRGNQLSGSIPSFATNTALQQLDLSINQLSGSIPSFATNTALQYLDLSINQLSGSIPSFASNTALQQLILHQNQLSGSIPSFASNTALQQLWLDYNQLSGSIPSFATNTALQQLLLNNNQLSGSIPSFASNTALQGLSLDSNQVSGSIPSFASNTALRYLTLDGNQLSGSIPSFAANTALYSLDLSYNQLSGSIPSFATNTALLFLTLDGNQLTGPVDSSLGTLTRLSAGAGLDLRWNALFSTDVTLIAFLDSKQNGGDWQSTQTIPVTGLSVSGNLPTQVTVSWMPIVYTADTGYYQVFTSTDSGGPYTPFATVTANKSAASLDVTGLNPLTRYYFVVQTTTLPNAKNQNTVLSGFGAEVSASPSSLLPTTTRFYTLPPCRIVDTRNADGPYGGPILAGGGAQRSFTVAGSCGVPATAVSVSANVTVTQPAAEGDVRVTPGDASVAIATIPFPVGVTRANNARLLLSSDGAGTVNVVSDGGAVHFILDVNGYFQ